MSECSVERWIQRLNDGDPNAVEPVFRAIEPYLRITVRRQLGHRLRAKVESVDIVQSVFAVFLQGMKSGTWRFAGRAELLAFLRRMVFRKIVDRTRQHSGALDRERSLDDLASVAFPVSGSPRPSQVAQAHEAWDRILSTCSPAQREMVRLRAEGWRINEIAARFGLHEGSVRRIFYDLARRLSISPQTNPRPDDVS